MIGFPLSKLSFHYKIIGDTNYPEIPDMTPIKFTKEREEFDVNITEEEIDKMKYNNRTT